VNNLEPACPQMSVGNLWSQLTICYWNIACLLGTYLGAITPAWLRHY
jgi:hypothetical protein